VAVKGGRQRQRQDAVGRFRGGDGQVHGETRFGGGFSKRTRSKFVIMGVITNFARK
jgi:hypothetical protein